MAKKKFGNINLNGPLLLTFAISIASSCIVSSDIDSGWN
jgi:hypothetical protein